MRSRSRLKPCLRALPLGLLTGLYACSGGGGTSRGVGDEGVEGTPFPILPSNSGPVLRGSVGVGAGTVHDAGQLIDPFSIAALFAASGLEPPAGNSQFLSGAIDDRGRPTATPGAISDPVFTAPALWPPASATDALPLALPAEVVDAGYAGAFDPDGAPAGDWTEGWTVALDGTLSRWAFFGGGAAPGTALFLSSQALANDQCPEGTTLAGRFSERVGTLARDETGLFFNSSGDYDVCRLPPRFDGSPETGGTLPMLTNDNVYELADGTGTYVGDGDTNRSVRPEPTSVGLTIEAGTLIFGEPGESLIVTRGSRIDAAGLVTAPITMTSLAQLQNRFDGDFESAAAGEGSGWGGLALMGRAPNRACPASPASCDVEDGHFGRHGGEHPEDDSGVLRHLIIRNAGDEASADASLKLMSTGRSTLIDRVQVHGGDGERAVAIEGGSTFLTHTVISGSRAARALDGGSGWTGGLQHLLLIAGPESSAGLFLDGEIDRVGAGPVTFPLVANLTVLGAAADAALSSQALLMGGGSRLQLWNSIFAGDFPSGCVDLDQAETFGRAGEEGGLPPTRPGPHLLFRNTVVDCTAVNFNENG